jgi:nitroreductase
MDVHQAIQTKRAERRYKDQPLPRDAIETILNAGRRAQSSKNTQPWHFIALQERENLQALAEFGRFTDHFRGAALVIAILTPHPDQRFSIMFDAGQSAAYMQLAAWDLGIGSCLGTIYEPEKARQLLGFPDDLHIRIAISFGYPLNPATIERPPEPGGRRQFDEVVHWERW